MKDNTYKFIKDIKVDDEVYTFNPITKESYFNEEKIVKWLSYGVQPTETVFQLLKKSNLIKV